MKTAAVLVPMCVLCLFSAFLKGNTFKIEDNLNKSNVAQSTVSRNVLPLKGRAASKVNVDPQNGRKSTKDNMENQKGKSSNKG